MLLNLLVLISSVAFASYGLACLVSPAMVSEFERYQLARWRVLVGLLEVGGSVGLVAGWWFAPLQAAAAAGLFLLMICGIRARWRIGDPWHAMLPAAVLGGVNAAILLLAL